MTGLLPAIRDRKSLWIGAGGGELPVHVRGMDVEIRGVEIDRARLDGYYDGFANRTLWPLLHNATTPSV